ncbi:MAG TPA: hypothetical protein VF641_11415, partial [Methylobacterium sp.]
SDDLFRIEAARVPALQKPAFVPEAVAQKPTAVPETVEQKRNPAPVASTGKPAAMTIAAVQWPPITDLTASNRPARGDELRPVAVPRPPARPVTLRDQGTRPAQLAAGESRTKPETSPVRAAQGGGR